MHKPRTVYHGNSGLQQRELAASFALTMRKSSKTFKVSDESENSYGIRVRTSGIKTDRFTSNPVMLFNHDFNNVLGKWEDLKTAGLDMTAVPVFDDEDTDAAKIMGKVDRDLIRGASIGVTPLVWKDDVIEECQLNEISITPMPSNRNAFVLYDNKGVKLSADRAKDYLMSLPKTKEHDKPKKTIMDKWKAALIQLCMKSGVNAVNLTAAEPTDEHLTEAITKIGEQLESKTNKLVELTNRIAAEKDARAVQLVDKAIADCKIKAGEKEQWLKDAKENLELTTRALNAIPGKVDINTKLKDEQAGGGDDKKKDERKDWNFTMWSQKDSTGLGNLPKEERAKLFKDEFGVDYE